jgi:hypothetical protein
MFGSRLENRMTGADQSAQIRQQDVEIVLDRMEQLCNGGHDPSRVKRS